MDGEANLRFNPDFRIPYLSLSSFLRLSDKGILRTAIRDAARRVSLAGQRPTVFAESTIQASRTDYSLSVIRDSQEDEISSIERFI